jgi:uncharacterized protein involved in response to NO
VLAGSALWWLAWLLARHAFDAAWPWLVPPGLAHGLLFSFGFMPLFFAGFLFTAAPKWLGLPPVPARDLLRPVVAVAAGWGLFGCAVHLHPLPAAAAVLVAALGWHALVRRLAALVALGTRPDRTHLRLIVAASRLGVLAQLAAAAMLAAGREDLARAALQLGLWGFVAPVFVVAVHRLLPVFDDDVAPALAARQPRWLLSTLVVLCLAQWPFALADLWWWPQPPAWQLAQAALDGAAAIGVLALAARWLRLQGLRFRLVAMLQLAVAWLGVAFALAAASQALLWASEGTRSLGLAAQHAFSMGFLGSAMMAMVTRVGSGLAGRTVAADGLAWALFGLLQLAVLLRIAAAAWPALEPALLPATAAAWCAAVAAWALRQAAWSGRARRTRAAVEEGVSP